MLKKSFHINILATSATYKQQKNKYCIYLSASEENDGEPSCEATAPAPAPAPEGEGHPRP